MSAGARARIRSALPWVIGLSLLGYLLWPYRQGGPRAQLLANFARAPHWSVGAAILGALVAFGADSLVTWLVLAWCSVRLRFREILVLRGATYFLAIVNYFLGQAALVYVLARHGVRPRRGAGITLFMMGVNVIVLLAIASISIAFGAPVPPVLKIVIYATAALLPVYLCLLLLKPAALTSRPLFAPLFELGLSGHLKGAVARLPHVGLMFLSQWIILRAFGVDVPFLAAALYFPVVFAVAVLPISAQGIGTSQAVLLKCFAPYAPGDGDAQRATILAYSLYLQAIWMATQIVIGLICIRTEFGQTLKQGAVLTSEKPSDIMK